MNEKRLSALEQKVRELYSAKDPSRAAEWADWLVNNHVFVVADFAEQLAKQKGSNVELARCAGFLHDIADINMGRTPEHAQASLDISAQLMREFGYSDQDIDIVVGDAIRRHNCHGDVRPKTDVGKILSTSDALAHLTTDFYLFATYMFRKQRSFDETKLWAKEKIYRDYNVKIAYDDIREQYKHDYEVLFNLFSR